MALKLSHAHVGTQSRLRVAPSAPIFLRKGVVSRAASAAGGADPMYDADILNRKTQVASWIQGWRSRTSGKSSASPAPAPLKASTSDVAPAAKPERNEFAEYFKLVVGLGILVAAEQQLKGLLAKAGLNFPASLMGMFAVSGGLMAVGEGAADKTIAFFNPALDWIAKWLPLFYVASLVVLPLNLAGIAAADLGKILLILAIGTPATLLFTAQTAVIIRGLVNTPNKEVGKAKGSSPLLPSHMAAWGAIAAASLAGTLVDPASLGPKLSLPFNLACTVLGFLIGNMVPKALWVVAHPVVTTAVAGNAGAALHGKLLGLNYSQAQKMYYSKGVGPMGAGDLLMGFLGAVIVSMGFRIYQQRATMKRHAPEILGATTLSSLFSFFSTALAAKALGLSASLAKALIPRSVTVALALNIAANLEAPLAITAAAVLLQGLLGANFGPALMSAVGIKDTIARGLAAAATAGGLGTASLTSREPEALPFCALSYSMIGILSTLFITSVPAVKAGLLALVGPV